MSLDRLIEKIETMKNPTVAGLDPKLEYVPQFIRERAVSEHGQTFEAAAAAILEFNKGLIDVLYDIIPAVKPQCAYYELYGWQGMRTLFETISYAKQKGMFVITDGKRNDIGSTMEAYAMAHLGKTELFGTSSEAFGGDALTVNGYLGTDGIAPLLKICNEQDKGIFVLAKTSNPSSGELQDKQIEARPVYEWMGDFCESWGRESIGRYGYSAVGAVVGATYKEQLADLRKKLPHTFFLVPGYGAQGAGAADVVPAFDKEKRGAVINSSRAIMCAYQKGNWSERDFAQAARQEALRMKEELAVSIGL